MSAPQIKSNAEKASAARRRGLETGERILDAAEDCFARKGFAGTTLRDVADHVGIRIPSLYNHFPNKDALYAAVLHRGISPLLALLAQSIKDSPKGYPDPKETVMAVMEWLSLRANLPRLVQYELLAGGERLAPLLAEGLRPAMAQSLAILEANPAMERWRPEEIPFVLLALFNIVVGHFTTSALTESLSPDPARTQEGTAAAAQVYGQLVETLLQEAPPPPKRNED